MLEYPITRETMHRYAREIFTPIARGGCVTTVWVPMTGRRRQTNFVINHIDIFKNELPEYEKFVLAYVDPLDLTEESKSGYIRLIGKSLIEASEKNSKITGHLKLSDYVKDLNDEESGYSKLLDVLKGLLFSISELGFEIVLFLGEFDEIEYVSPVFFGNLKSLWNKLYPHLHFVFLIRGRATRPENIKLWGEELSEIIFQNVVYVPILIDQDIEFMFERLSREMGYQFTKDEKGIIKKMCGGHPYMLKVAAQTLAISRNENKDIEVEKLLSENLELNSIATRIYRRQTDKDKAVLDEIARGKRNRLTEKGEAVEFLLKMGIITLDSRGYYRLFSTVFKDAINRFEKENKETTQNELRIDGSSKRVFMGSKSAEDKFSRQELAIIKLFLTSKEEFSSREQIAKALWGEKTDNKYSNWAIDQIVSKLRKKFRELGVNSEIVTLRGEGYKFYSSTE